MYHYFWADDPWVMGQKLKLFKITSKHGNMCFGPKDPKLGHSSQKGFCGSKIKVAQNLMKHILASKHF